jgi:transcriptional regulator with XRE-family HTH domain
METEAFVQLSLRELQALTGIDRHRWSRYFNQRIYPNEKTLLRAAKSLNMEPGKLLDAIQAKRAHLLSVKTKGKSVPELGEPWRKL